MTQANGINAMSDKASEVQQVSLEDTTISEEAD